METTTNKNLYNLRAKKERENAPMYRGMISPERADKLYDQVMEALYVDKKYCDPDYSAKQMAKELRTNTRYLSAVINSRFGKNYSCVVNELRIKNAQHYLIDRRHADKSIEEISAMAGFANRQSFYAAFYKYVGVTPKEYRKKNTPQS